MREVRVIHPTRGEKKNRKKKISHTTLYLPPICEWGYIGWIFFSILFSFHNCRCPFTHISSFLYPLRLSLGEILHTVKLHSPRLKEMEWEKERERMKSKCKKEKYFFSHRDGKWPCGSFLHREMTKGMGCVFPSYSLNFFFSTPHTYMPNIHGFFTINFFIFSSLSIHFSLFF